MKFHEMLAADKAPSVSETLLWLVAVCILLGVSAFSFWAAFKAKRINLAERVGLILVGLACGGGMFVTIPHLLGK